VISLNRQREREREREREMFNLSSLAMEAAPEPAGLGRTPHAADHGYCYGPAASDNDIDYVKLLDLRRNMHPIETNRSLDERSLSDLISANLHSSPRLMRPMETVKSSECLEALLSPSIRSSVVCTPRDRHSFEPHPMIGDAWDALRRSIVFFRNQPVGTIAAMDPTEDSLNYNQVLQ
jgi:hypothetical protein